MIGSGWCTVDCDVRYVWFRGLSVWIARREFAEVAFIVFADSRGKWSWRSVASGIVEVEVGYT